MGCRPSDFDICDPIDDLALVMAVTVQENRMTAVEQMTRKAEAEERQRQRDQKNKNKRRRGAMGSGKIIKRRR